MTAERERGVDGPRPSSTGRTLMANLRRARDMLYDAVYKLAHPRTRRPPAGGPQFARGEDGEQTYFRHSSKH